MQSVENQYRGKSFPSFRKIIQFTFCSENQYFSNCKVK